MGIDPRRHAARLATNVLLTEDEAAALLHVQPATLAAWRGRGQPQLPFVRIGRCIRYHRQDLVAFIDAHRSAGPTRGQA